MITIRVRLSTNPQARDYLRLKALEHGATRYVSGDVCPYDFDQALTQLRAALGIDDITPVRWDYPDRVRAHVIQWVNIWG